MAVRQNETDSPHKTVRAKKTIGTISILFFIFVATLVIIGAFRTGDRNVKIHHAQDALSGLKTTAYSAMKADGGYDDAFVRNMAFQELSTAQSNKHGVVLEDRTSLTLTGVKEVADFTENKIVVQTELGQLTITGRSLHIGKFDTKTGEVHVAGTIDSLVYSNENKNTSGFFERFKKSIRTFPESVKSEL